ncbi:phosphodiester glycosidase family protein [Ideonella sp. 4Y16]|uniref:phosphodiester glycosidase family protein n=1 Tax=Ideonella alba TaxID=2824118 RepID=UPI001B38228C|nr:phosphodiester glycosidase family protein [Ideonella alba]MBQ0942241.1 phosphodiester glycosidase family protein [Ideonella alba]
MSKIATWACLLLHASWACGAGQPDERLDGLLQQTRQDREVLHGGRTAARFVTYRDADPASATYGVELCVLEAGSARLRVKDIRQNQSPRQLFPSVFRDKALGAMTGGFFGKGKGGELVPMGWVKSEGREFSPRHPWTSGGFVAWGSQGAAIVPVSKARSLSAYPQVLQSKPLLIEQGRNGIRTAGEDRFDRSAVALDDRGRLYFIVLHEPAGRAGSLAEFSHVLLRYRSADGQALRQALAMDGGPGAHLYVPALDRHCGSGVPNYVPNALYLEP